jgi:hypothetical protein
MDLKKAAFIEGYVKSFGNITASCRAAEISRTTYYNWMREDESFKAQIETVEPNEIFVDFAENALIKRIRAEDTTAIIFALKTKGKKRGYVERQEIEAKIEETKYPAWFSNLPVITTTNGQLKES